MIEELYQIIKKEEYFNNNMTQGWIYLTALGPRWLGPTACSWSATDSHLYFFKKY